jgi:hypothetical protein
MPIGQWTVKFCLATLLLTSCSSTSTPATSTEPPPLENPATPAVSPWNELETLAVSTNAADYSRLSISHDGIFAVILRDKKKGNVATVGTFTLWRWDGKVWNDVTTAIRDLPLGPEYFVPRSTLGARIVTSYDYNQDGIVDFLVNFNEAELGLNHEVGGILSIRGGEWHWETIKFVDGTEGQAGTSLYFWPESNRLSIRDYPPDQMATDLDVMWNDEWKMFVVQDGLAYGD